MDLNLIKINLLILGFFYCVFVVSVTIISCGWLFDPIIYDQ